MLKWFNISWYKYLFKKRNGYSNIGWVKTIICRLKNHLYGVVWYNIDGLEPNMHCRNCGDDLG